MEYIITCISVILIVILTIWLTRDTKFIKVERGQQFDIKNSLDLTGLSVIVLCQGEKKYNFMLDTGSNVSYINRGSEIELSEVLGKDSMTSANGNVSECSVHNATLYYAQRRFDIPVRVTDLGTIFNATKEEFGVTLTGILGSDFLQKYKYVLDYAECVVYSRKV